MANNIQSTVRNTNTIAGMINALMPRLNSPFNPRLPYTINAKRNVYPNTTPTKYPSLKYFGIGINGFYNINDTNKSVPYNPRETNMDLFQPIPFRIVPIDQDLSPAERAQYRMRTIEEPEPGQFFAAYWLKVIDFPDNEVQIKTIDLNTSEVNDFEFDDSNLTPTPIKDTGVDILTSVDTKVVVSSGGRCTITGAEVAEAINILHNGDNLLARISEFGFYTGQDKTDAIAQDANGDDFTYTEAIHVELATHRTSTGHDLSDFNTTITEEVVYQNGSAYLS